MPKQPTSRYKLYERINAGMSRNLIQGSNMIARLAPYIPLTHNDWYIKDDLRGVIYPASRAKELLTAMNML